MDKICVLSRLLPGSELPDCCSAATDARGAELRGPGADHALIRSQGYV